MIVFAKVFMGSHAIYNFVVSHLRFCGTSLQKHCLASGEGIPPKRSRRTLSGLNPYPRTSSGFTKSRTFSISTSVLSVCSVHFPPP